MPDDRNPAYRFQSHHELYPRFCSVMVQVFLPKLVSLVGSVPAALETEAGIMAFANEAGIPLVDADLEALNYLPLPNKHHASRPWVQAAYVQFRAWAVENGWVGPDGEYLETPASPTPDDPKPEPAAEKPRRGRPKKEPAGV